MLLAKTYEYDPAKIKDNGKDRMRFELGDTMVEGASDTCALTDEEIEAALSIYPDRWKRAKLALLESICRRFAYEVNTTEGPVRLELMSRAKLWREDYEALKKELSDSGTSVVLKDTTNESAVDVLTITAKYVGTRALAVTVKESLTEENVKDIVIFDGKKMLELFSISSGAKEVDEAIAALADSKYVTATKKAEGNGILAVVSQAKLAGGEDPEVTTSAYSTGFDAVEPEMGGVTSVIAVDTDDTAVHALLAAFVRRTYESGCYPIGCVGEPKSVAIDTRIEHAKTFDSEQMVYVLNGWYDASGIAHEGHLAAARIAGMIAAIASNDSLTHKSILNATTLVESMTNSQIVKAIKNGCLVISTSFVKQIRIEKAINTLVTATADKDEGWKKIRRLKTRYEVMYRIDEAVDALVGSINNDDNGRAAIIAAGQGVLDAMVGEQKLIAGCEMILDPNNKPEGDSAWFLINADDIDSFEIGYLAYGFRFAAEA